MSLFTLQNFNPDIIYLQRRWKMHTSLTWEDCEIIVYEAHNYPNNISASVTKYNTIRSLIKHWKEAFIFVTESMFYKAF